MIVDQKSATGKSPAGRITSNIGGLSFVVVCVRERGFGTFQPRVGEHSPTSPSPFPIRNAIEFSSHASPRGWKKARMPMWTTPMRF